MLVTVMIMTMQRIPSLSPSVPPFLFLDRQDDSRWGWVGLGWVGRGPSRWQRLFFCIKMLPLSLGFGSRSPKGDKCNIWAGTRNHIRAGTTRTGIAGVGISVILRWGCSCGRERPGQRGRRRGKGRRRHIVVVVVGGVVVGGVVVVVPHG